MIYLIKNNKIKSNCIDHINSLSQAKEWQVEIKPYKRKRSVQQNRLYWLYLKEISQGVFESGGNLIPDRTWHLYYRQVFLGMVELKVNGITVWDLQSTTKLNVIEFNDYIEKIELHAGSEFGIGLPPDTLSTQMYAEAMGR
jgi:hypothetical protein